MNELINNEVLENVAENAVEAVSENPKLTFGHGVVTGVVGTVAVGGAVKGIKWLVNNKIKPAIAKRKAKKEAEKAEKTENKDVFDTEKFGE